MSYDLEILAKYELFRYLENKFTGERVEVK